MLFGASGLLFVVVFAFWVWAILDVVSTDAEACRTLPKVVWLIVVFVLLDIGAVAWVLFGRPAKGRWLPRATDFATPRRPIGAEDHPAFETRGEITDRRSRELDELLEAWEADQRARKRDGEPDS